MIIFIILTIAGVTVITGAGQILLTYVCPKLPNLYIRTALAFSLGNLIFILLLSLLAGINALHVSPTLFLIIGLLEVVYFTIEIRKRKPKIKIDKKDGLILIAIALFIAAILFSEFLTPLADWDTRAIWGMKAKSFFLDNGLDNFYLTSSHYNNSHRDYPNGLSLMMALFFRLYGTLQEQAVKLYLITFYIHILLLHIGTLKHYFNRVPPLLTICLTAALLYTPKFIHYSPSGYADIPLSLIFASAILCMLLAAGSDSLKKASPYLLTGILCAITGLYFKNEGLSFFIVYSVGISVLVVLMFTWTEIVGFFKKNRRYAIAGSIFLVMSLAGFIQWEITKRHLDITGPLPFSFEKKAIYEHHDKIITILQEYLFMLSNSSNWGLLVAPASLIFTGTTIYYFIKKGYRSHSIPGIIILMQLGVYTATYFFSIYDLEWHLNTSLERLFIHLIPAALLVTIYSIHIVLKKFEHL